MPSNALTVARQIRVWRDKTMSPQALSLNLATVAKKTRDALIKTGEAAPAYETFVDGRKGAAEETVRPDGAILYQFNVLGQAAKYALSFAVGRSPKHDGDYKRAWFVAVDGKKWTGDLNDIPAGSEVMVTNPLPYARKIDVGHMKMRVAPGIVEDTRQAVKRKFPTIDAARTMVTIPVQLGGGYVLKGHHRKGFRLHARKALRSDTQKGAAMTYPALILKAR
jgi:hypothetical protein